VPVPVPEWPGIRQSRARLHNGLVASGSRSSGPIAVGQRRAGAPEPGPRTPAAARQKAPAPRTPRRRDPLLDPDAPSWGNALSVAACVLLVLAALVALAFQKPGAIKLGKRGFAAASAPGGVATSSPTVEPLARRSAAARSALAEQDHTLAGGLVREVDVIAAGARPACFGLEPEGDICLGPGARMRIGALGQGVELLDGRAVVSVERLGVGVSLVVALGALRVEARDAVLGLELDADRAVVRVLRGAALVAHGERTDTLVSAHSALYRSAARTLEVIPQLPEKARRDWELLAARSARN
jgi:hypothetical protein